MLGGDTPSVLDYLILQTLVLFKTTNHYISVAMVYPREYVLFFMVDVIFL